MLWLALLATQRAALAPAPEKLHSLKMLEQVSLNHAIVHHDKFLHLKCIAVFVYVRGLGSQNYSQVLAPLLWCLFKLSLATHFTRMSSSHPSLFASLYF